MYCINIISFLFVFLFFNFGYAEVDLPERLLFFPFANKDISVCKKKSMITWNTGAKRSYAAKVHLLFITALLTANEKGSGVLLVCDLECHTLIVGVAKGEK